MNGNNFGHRNLDWVTKTLFTKEFGRSPRNATEFAARMGDLASQPGLKCHLGHHSLIFPYEDEFNSSTEKLKPLLEQIASDSVQGVAILEVAV
ncbi:MAG: hypothetical protein OHK0035_31700 [Cyanobacteria bacterium J069]